MKNLIVRGGAVLAALILTATITPAASAAPTPTPTPGAQTSSPAASASPTTRTAAPQAAQAVGEPTFDDPTSTVTIPELAGIEYQLDGVVVVAGPQQVAVPQGGRTVTVTARSTDGVTPVPEPGTWTHFFPWVYTPVQPDYDDQYSNARAYPPEGFVVVEYKKAEDPDTAWTLLPRVWAPMVTGTPILFRFRATDNRTLVKEPATFTHTFPGRTGKSLSAGDEFNEPGLSNEWAVSARDTTIGPTKGKGYFRPENVTVKDGNLQIKSARHCLPVGADGKALEEMSESNMTSEVCPAGTMTTYSVGRIDTNFTLSPPRSMEVRAMMDGSSGNHNGITTTAWTHNSQGFCEGGVVNSDMVEMDTMEIWKQSMSHNSTHINCRNGKSQNIGDRIDFSPGKVPGKWRTWRMEFDGYAIRYFLDGEEVLKQMPSRGVTAEIAGMTQEDYTRTVTGYPFKLSVYTVANPNGGWAPFVDDAKPFAPKYDKWDYVRWENFDPKAANCAPAGEIAAVAAATPGLGENWTCERGTEAPPGEAPIGRVQDFTGGRVYQTPSAGAVALVGSAWTRFVELGGERVLGVPTAPSRQLGEATVQEFTNGILVTSASGTRLVKGEIGAKWLTVADTLGLPQGEETCGLRDGGCIQTFANGSIIWSPATGAQLIRGRILTRYTEMGRENSELGYPTGDEICGIRDGGCWQQFQYAGSRIYWSPASDAQFIRGEILAKYAELGSENSFLGYPITGEICGIRDGGCFQRFQGADGHIYWTGTTGAHYVRGRIFAKYAEMGWETSNIGYPISDEICGMRDGGCFQRFQGENGHIYWSAATDAHFVRGAIFERYGALGWETGSFGYPITDEICGIRDGGCFQRFQGESGHIYWSPASGAWGVQGAIFGHYQLNGWETGRFGYPVGPEECRNLPDARECTQTFQGGRIVWNSRYGLSG
ncbi:hypothetical protein [Enemella evansiae]|uniref:hypothetical protein n=1 Tax=Enemella evansiae TaxID=2016499 RepID=UPI000B97A2E0|nr:hypothetical protein [Enemella evansiae]OYO00195.1 hypothetical protein CGZ97_19405 [Enemella evansiae]